MKKFFVICVLILGVLCLLFFPKKAEIQSNEYLRIHIRANSNDREDQAVKLFVKEKVVEFLSPYIENCTDKEKAIEIISSLKEEMKEVADNALKVKGFSYTSKVEIKKEEFPTRAYGDFVLDSGVYDAIIILLGSGAGDNWWCVVYPPLCFTGSETCYGDVKYRSKILEIIKAFKNKYL